MCHPTSHPLMCCPHTEWWSVTILGGREHMNEDGPSAGYGHVEGSMRPGQTGDRAHGWLLTEALGSLGAFTHAPSRLSSGQPCVRQRCFSYLKMRPSGPKVAKAADGSGGRSYCSHVRAPVTTLGSVRPPQRGPHRDRIGGMPGNHAGPVSNLINTKCRHNWEAVNRQNLSSPLPPCLQLYCN